MRRKSLIIDDLGYRFQPVRIDNGTSRLGLAVLRRAGRAEVRPRSFDTPVIAAAR